jgi:hypothetical protein
MVSTTARSRETSTPGIAVLTEIQVSSQPYVPVPKLKHGSPEPC